MNRRWTLTVCALGAAFGVGFGTGNLLSSGGGESPAAVQRIARLSAWWGTRFSYPITGIRLDYAPGIDVIGFRLAGRDICEEIRETAGGFSATTKLVPCSHLTP